MMHTCMCLFFAPYSDVCIYASKMSFVIQLVRPGFCKRCRMNWGRMITCLSLVAVNFVKFVGLPLTRQLVSLAVACGYPAGTGKETQCQGIACSYGLRHQNVKKSGAINVGRLRHNVAHVTSACDWSLLERAVLRHMKGDFCPELCRGRCAISVAKWFPAHSLYHKNFRPNTNNNSYALSISCSAKPQMPSNVRP